MQAYTTARYTYYMIEHTIIQPNVVCDGISRHMMIRHNMPYYAITLYGIVYHVWYTVALYDGMARMISMRIWYNMVECSIYSTM